MLRWRLIFAAAFLTPLFALLAVDFRWSGSVPGVWLLPFGLVFGLLATAELAELLSGSESAPPKGPLLVGFAGIYLASWIPALWPLRGEPYPVDCPLGRLGWPLCALAIALGVLFVLEMRRYSAPGGHVVRLALGTFVLVYLGLMLAFLAPLRQFGDNATGMTAMVSLLLIVKIADTGAYTAGRLLGRHPMAPLLSPKKTWEGAVGGLLSAAVVAWMYFRWIAPFFFGTTTAAAAWQCATYGIILAVAGMMGDLCESLIKRDVQQKESSSWIRGLGGMLDVLDSVLIAAPVAYLCWAAGLVS